MTMAANTSSGNAHASQSMEALAIESYFTPNEAPATASYATPYEGPATATAETSDRTAAPAETPASAPEPAAGKPSASSASYFPIRTPNQARNVDDEDDVAPEQRSRRASRSELSRFPTSPQRDTERMFRTRVKRTSTDAGPRPSPTSFVPPRPGRPRAATRWSVMPQGGRRGTVTALNDALWAQQHLNDSDTSSDEEEHKKPDDENRLKLERTPTAKLSKKDRNKSKTIRERVYSHFFVGNENFSTKGRVDSKDGRLNISLFEGDNKGYIANRLRSGLLKKHTSQKPELQASQSSKQVPLKDEPAPELPRLNVVIMVIGSRGDIQPFLRLGKILKEDYGHRVRVATHPAFRDFVQEDSGLEFFSVGGDPSELMAFMVKNPGLIPSMETVWAGEIGRRREQMAEMFDGFWRACINATDDEKDTNNLKMMGDKYPFVADAIIANPPSFAHVHCAEALGIPLHLMFTFPYTPTQAFPHPLANIKKTNVDPGYTNLMSYPLVEMMTWQGLGDLVNDFRTKTLGLEAVSTLWAPGQLYRLDVPYTYLWSPGLVPKPADWGDHIDVTGFVFLDLATSFKPPEELTKFLEAGEKPVYIGFGSIVVDDPDKFTELIFEAIKLSGVRALVSKGWGGLGGKLKVPDNVFLLDNTPHDWLFPRVRAVVHHGGAGTTAIGLKLGKPTMIVPFFGDQQFWGSMITRAGAGPEAVPYKFLTAEKLADGIKYCLTDEALEKAQGIAKSIEAEGDGAVNAVKSFLRRLPMTGPRGMRCVMLEDRIAAWYVKNTSIRLSPLAAELLVERRKLSWRHLRLLRTCEWNEFGGAGEPLTGTATAVFSNIANAASGIGSIPYRVAKYSRQRRQHNAKKQRLQEQLRRTQQPASISAPATSVEPASQRKINIFSKKIRVPTKRKSKESVEKGKENEADPSIPSIGGSETTQVEGGSAQPSEQHSLTETGDQQSLKPKPVAESQDSRPPPTLEHMQADKQAEEVQNAAREAKQLERETSEKQSQETTTSSHNSNQQAAFPDEQAERLSIISEDPSDMFAEHVAEEVAHGLGKTGEAIVRAPMDISVAVAQGFHNAPRLYGDDTVRGLHRITGFKSGLTAAGQEFVFGLYDGFTGVVTQPYKHAKEEGALGFVKGVGMGLTGLILKSLAALIGPFAYTLKGVQREFQKSKQPAHFVRRARINQGQRELRELQLAGEEGARKLKEYDAKLDHGWDVVQQVYEALHEENNRGLKGKITRRREVNNWRQSGAFESIKAAEEALEKKRRGERIGP